METFKILVNESSGAWYAGYEGFGCGGTRAARRPRCYGLKKRFRLPARLANLWAKPRATGGNRRRAAHFLMLVHKQKGVNGTRPRAPAWPRCVFHRCRQLLPGPGRKRRCRRPSAPVPEVSSERMRSTCFPDAGASGITLPTAAKLPMALTRASAYSPSRCTISVNFPRFRVEKAAPVSRKIWQAR